MGGQGSGGSRPGAGRKKKPEHLRLIDGGADRRGPRPDDAAGAAPPADEAAPAIEAPAGLTDAELAVWNEWAPLAIAERTLTPATARAFAHLCELEADRREIRGRYLVGRKGDGALLILQRKEELALRREHRTLAKDIKAALKDFKLAPFGKEIDGAGGAGGELEDPLDAFTRKRG